ncbi:hypothetical protein KY321_01130, partial [Candidatus Woesearchaeota archaeon]|nr:hypothetical protein [Candidatus Woesearchaeota archaeon]
MIDKSEIKKYLLFNLIGSLIICALIGVVTVLVGDFNELMSRVLFTVLMVTVHSIVALMFVWDTDKENTFTRLGFFSNSLFLIVILSFLTSIFGVWELIDGEIILKMYLTYFVLGFAALHGNILAKAFDKEKYLDGIILANYVFMTIVVLMILPIIHMGGT